MVLCRIKTREYTPEKLFDLKHSLPLPCSLSLAVPLTWCLSRTLSLSQSHLSSLSLTFTQATHNHTKGAGYVCPLFPSLQPQALFYSSSLVYQVTIQLTQQCVRPCSSSFYVWRCSHTQAPASQTPRKNVFFLPFMTFCPVLKFLGPTTV